MKELATRKPNRLHSYDYSCIGAYFVTVCTKNREQILAEIVGAASCRPSMVCRPQLTDIGAIVENEILVLSATYSGIFVDKFVVMPNHVHMIIRIDVGGRSGENRRQNAAPTVSQMINQWKRAISMKIGFSPWQKSFHDHVIRSQEEYDKIWNYIENNPLSWDTDEENRP